MLQAIGLILILFIIKLVIDNLKPPAVKDKGKSKGDIIDISGKWVNAEEMPYQKNESFLSRQELQVFQLLQDILQNTQYSIYPHLRLTDVLQVPSGTQNRQEYLFRIKERGLDMVIFKSNDLELVLVVHFSGSKGAGQTGPDMFTRTALQAAGIKSISIDLNTPSSREETITRLRQAGLSI